MATFNINSYQGKSNYALTNTFMHMVYQYVNEVNDIIQLVTEQYVQRCLIKGIV